MPRVYIEETMFLQGLLSTCSGAQTNCRRRFTMLSIHATDHRQQMVMMHSFVNEYDDIKMYVHNLSVSQRIHTPGVPHQQPHPEIR